MKSYASIQASVSCIYRRTFVCMQSCFVCKHEKMLDFCILWWSQYADIGFWILPLELDTLL